MKRALLMVVTLVMTGCGPAASKGGFDSANPAAKMYAIEYAARDGDRTALAQIIDQLDSDDPAVRMLAISALKRMTGETYGYRDYDTRLERRPAIDRWRQALQSGELESQMNEIDHSPHPASTSPSTAVDRMHHDVQESSWLK